MSAPLVLPTTTTPAFSVEAITRALDRDLRCTVEFGEDPGAAMARCVRPAVWKVIMSCCGHNEFLCSPCYQDLRHNLVRSWMMCGGCHTKHWMFKAGVAGAHRI